MFIHTAIVNHRVTFPVNHGLLTKSHAFLQNRKMEKFDEHEKIKNKIKIWLIACADEFRRKPKGKRKTKQDLADFCGVTKQAAGRWFQTGKISKENLVKAIEFYGSSPDLLLHENVVFERPLIYNAEPAPDITGRVPLISWVQAGYWAEVIDNYQPGDAEEWRLTTAKVTKNAFALRIVGDSMTNPYGSPSLPPGSIVIVEPNREPKNGDIVVARLDDNQEATIKKLVIEGNQKFLKPLNPQYPIIPINSNCSICGVAIKVEFDL